MRLQVLQTQGLPPNSVLSVKSGSSRRQQLLPCQAPFKVDQPPVPVQLDVLTYAAKGQEVLPDPSEQFLKVPLSKGGRNMSVTFRIQKGDPGAGEETGQSAEMSRKDKAALIESYLAKHRLHDFMKEVFQGLTAEQPEDPFLYIGRCLQAAAAKDVACQAGVAQETGPSPVAVDNSAVQQKKASVLQRLRRKARESLAKGYLDGRLQSALCSLPEHSADLPLPNSPHAGVAPAPAGGSVQHSPEAALTPVQRLRRKARETLAKGYLDGRLQSALRSLPENTADLPLPNSPHAGVAPVPAGGFVQPHCPEAAAGTAMCQEHEAEVLPQHPAMQVQSVQYEQPVAGLAASINPTNSAEPAEWQQIEQAVVSNCLKTEEATAVAVVTPEPAASPSALCGWVGDQVEPFVAHPAPSAWVTDDNNEDLDIDTPRLSRFEPCAFRRRPSARSESSVAVSEDLLDFVPDRSAWLLHGEKDRPPSAALAPLAPAAYPSAASRWSHRSRTSEKQALQAMLAEFTPRMSEFIPSSKEPPSTQQELLHLRPHERLTSSHVDFSLDEDADPDLNAFVPVRHDPGMAGTSAMHLGPPRELRWEVPGLADEGATPRLTQFMPCYPGVRA